MPLPGLLSHSPPWFSQSREMAGFGEGGAGLWRGWGLVLPHATAPFLVCPNSFPPSLLGPKPSLPWILEACRECPLGDTHGRLEQVRPQPSSRSAGRMRTQQPFADQLLGLKHYLAFFLLPVGCFPGHTCSDGTQSERTASPSWLLGQTSCGRAGVLPALVPQPRGEAANHITLQAAQPKAPAVHARSATNSSAGAVQGAVLLALTHTHTHTLYTRIYTISQRKKY